MGHLCFLSWQLLSKCDSRSSLITCSGHWFVQDISAYGQYVLSDVQVCYQRVSSAFDVFLIFLCSLIQTLTLTLTPPPTMHYWQHPQWDHICSAFYPHYVCLLLLSFRTVFTASLQCHGLPEFFLCISIVFPLGSS